MAKPPSERFFSKVDKSQGAGACWIWTGARVNGYGQFYAGPGAPARLVNAHRWSYEFHVGPVPDGLQLDHRCHSADRTCMGGPTCLHRACVNPAHLEPVTGKVNVQRTPLRVQARRGLHNTIKSHCPRGHEYTPDNTYVHARSNGWTNRVCRTCKRMRWAEDVAKKPKVEKPPRTGFIAASRKAWPEDLDRARALMNDGASLREAARQIGLSHTQLRRRLLGIR